MCLAQLVSCHPFAISSNGRKYKTNRIAVQKSSYDLGGGSGRTMSETQNVRILLVEDHLLTRIGLKTVIERVAEFKVIGEAENGEDAVRKVDELTPDVVLMDVGMPVMDGIEASRKIKEKHGDVEIVMLTSHDNERDIFASLAAGAGGYCLKDVEPERLYSAIRSVRAGDVWLDSTIAGKVLIQRRFRRSRSRRSCKDRCGKRQCRCK
jgi:DNA-binding NarL/FixJ family response regulator